MKGALKTIPLDLAQTERRSAVGALINNTSDLAVGVSKQGQLQIKPFDADDLISLYCFGWQDCIPLIGYHRRDSFRIRHF
jgi:hypothetical protein